MKKKSIIVFLIGGLLIALMTLIAYAYNFRNQLISDDSTYWGSFGDYFGGVFNSIVGVANLFFLIFLTFAIADLDEKRSQRELANQKNFALFSLRHDALKDVDKIFEGVDRAMQNWDQRTRLGSIWIATTQIKGFVDVNTYLFPILKDFNIQPITKLLVRLMSATTIVQELHDSKKEVNFELQEKYGEIGNLNHQITDWKTWFITKLANEIDV
jgi:uncharacterized membrane protein